MCMRMKFLRRKREEKVEKDSLTPHVLRVQDLFNPAGLLDEFDCVILGDRWCKVYGVFGLPREVTVGFLDEIFFAGDVDLSVHMEPVSDREVLSTLTRRETQARAQYDLDRKAGNIYRLPELEAQIRDYRTLREAVQLGQDRLFRGTVFIAVHGHTRDELRRRCDLVESVLARRGVLAHPLVLRQAAGLKSVLPLASNRVEDFAKNMTTGVGASCLPVTASGSGHTKGILLGFNYFTGSPVLLDRFAGEKIISNQHLFISGEPGSGKSVSKRLIALLEGYRGIRTAFVDPENEYIRFTENLGGLVVRLKPGMFSGMNPLELEPEQQEDKTWRVNVLEKVADVRGLVGAVFRYFSGDGLTAREAALLEEAVLEEYRARGVTHDPESLYEGGIKKPMPTLSDIQKRLAAKPGGERVADGMKPLFSGGSLGMFDGQTTLTLKEAPYICFALKGLGDDLARFVGVYAVLSWLWQMFAQRGGREVPKCVAVDEAWMFLRHPDAALYLETLARRGRKHGCALTVATQRFEEFASREAGRAVIESCATILVLRQEEHAVNAVTEYFHLSEGCRKILSGEHARPGLGILRVSGQTFAVQVTPAPFEWDYVETKVGV